MPRFFVTREEIDSSFMVLTGENAAHAKVLRLKNGDEVTVCDGAGTDYRCTVSDVANGQISLVVHSADPSESEARVRCSIYMALPKADKLEHVIQKATELGAHEIVCFPSARCVSKPDEKSLQKKLERWQKIAASAAEQSRRGMIPDVIALPSYRAALERAAQFSPFPKMRSNLTAKNIPSKMQNSLITTQQARSSRSPDRKSIFTM